MTRVIRKTSVACLAGTLLLALASPVASASAKSPHSDQWLEAELTTAYALNPHLGASRLQVQVRHGVATVRGTVGSPAEHDLALEIAKGADGISKVDDEIQVQPSKSPSTTSHPDASGTRSFARRVEDATTTASVKMRLLWNRNTDGLDVHVSTHDATVTLRGTVPTATVRALAVQIAENTDGVKKVADRMQINPNPETVGQKVGHAVGSAVDKTDDFISDAWISFKVAGSLDYSNRIDSDNVRVDTKGGQVTLSGTVASDQQRALATKIAADVVGVKSVRNELRAAPQHS